MSKMRDGRERSWFSIITMVVLCLLWSIPTIGLLITSLRSRDDVLESGWWTAVFNPLDTRQL
jgi:alpha-glucoside transport system permease protein